MRASDSISVTSRSGRSAASTRPGKSGAGAQIGQFFGSVGIRSELRRIEDMAAPDIVDRRRADQVDGLLPLQQDCDMASSRSRVSRETSTRRSRIFRLEWMSLSQPGMHGSRLGRPATDVLQEGDQGGRGNAGDPGGLARGWRAGAPQFLADFVGQAADGGIVEVAPAAPGPRRGGRRRCPARWRPDSPHSGHRWSAARRYRRNARQFRPQRRQPGPIDVSG